MTLLKKTFLLTLAYCMLLTQAFAVGYDYVEQDDYERMQKINSQELIKKAFDTYRYRMTVEWDQNDSAFKAHAKAEFEKDILMLKAQGVSTNQIKNYMTSTMLDAQAKADYENLVNAMVKQGKSEEEISRISSKFMEKNYSTGASYSGGASSGWGVAGVILALVVVAVITVIIVRECRDDNDDHDDRDPQDEDPCDHDWYGENSYCYPRR